MTTIDASRTAPDHADTEERLNRGQVAGALLLARLAWVDSYGDHTDRQRMMDALPSGTDLSELTPRTWVPFAWLVSVDRAICESFGEHDTDPAVLEDLGRFAARLRFQNRTERWTSDPHSFFQAMTGEFDPIQDFATIQYQRLNDKRGQFVHVGKCFSRIFCGSIVGYYEQILLLQGTRRPMVNEQMCQGLGWASCKFDLRWR